jgi:hypothetical protein
MNPISFSAVLDFETLDTTPTAVVTEIGCIIARRRYDEIDIVDRVALFPNILLQLADGRTHTRDTILWHRKNGTIPMQIGDQTLESCTRLLMETLSFPGLNRIWAWGKDFERPLLENICTASKVELPSYHFRKFTCARDHWQSAFGMDAKSPPRTHHALRDCEDELRDLVAALNELRIFHTF